MAYVHVLADNSYLLDLLHNVIQSGYKIPPSHRMLCRNFALFQHRSIVRSAGSPGISEQFLLC